MENTQLDSLRYPIGRLKLPETISAVDIADWINEIEQTPANLRKAVQGLTDEQLDTPYREGGWTLRQVVHHVCDSHVNSYVRFKWTLTEEKPTIKVYDEKAWAELEEAKTAPVELSLAILETLHLRWVKMLRNITPKEWQRSFIHPEYGKEYKLEWLVALYAWHGNHHIAHIQSLKERMNWV